MIKTQRMLQHFFAGLGTLTFLMGQGAFSQAQIKANPTSSVTGVLPVQTAQIPLVQNGKAVTAIVTADEPFPIAAYAARELAYHLELATGANIPILPESKADAAQPSRIYIGASKAASAAGIKAETLLTEECAIRTIGNSLYIVGNDGPGEALNFENINSGTLWGVYEILERLTQARWLWPGEGGIAIEKRDSLFAPQFNEIIRPQLRTRLVRTYAPWINNAPLIFPENEAVQKTGLAFSTIEAYRDFLTEQQIFLRRHRMGQGQTSSYSVGHDFTSWWNEYGQTHPEWFQLIPADKGEFAGKPSQERARLAYGRPEKTWEGRRGPENPAAPHMVSMCVSDSNLQKEIIRRWQAERAKKPGQEVVINAGENDVWAICVCDDCVALDDKPLSAEAAAKLPGSVAGLNYPFNAGRRYAIFYQRLHEMASKIDPDAKVLGYVYLNYFLAPKDVKLHPNIILTFVPWGGFWYPRDPREQAWLRDQWQQWRNLGATLFHRPNFVLDGGSMPHNYMHQMTDEFDFYLRNGAIGTDFDASLGQWSAQNATLYALLRKHTRPEMTTSEILEELYTSFGAAAFQVKAYFDFWEANSITNAALKPEVWGKYDATNLLTYARVAPDLYPPSAFARGEELLAAAEKAAAGDAPVLQRVQYLRLGLQHAQKVAAVSTLFADKTATLEQRRAALEDLVQFRRATEKLNVANYTVSAAEEVRSFSDRYDFGTKIVIEVKPADTPQVAPAP